MNWPETHVLHGLLDCALAGPERADIHRYLDDASRWTQWVCSLHANRRDEAAVLRRRLYEIMGAYRTQLIEEGLI
jgi:hypothetical protein